MKLIMTYINLYKSCPAWSICHLYLQYIFYISIHIIQDCLNLCINCKVCFIIRAEKSVPAKVSNYFKVNWANLVARSSRKK